MWAKTMAENRAMSLRSAAKSLLVLALALPIVQAVLIWIRVLLAGMGDEAGAVVIDRCGTVCHVVWSICVVGLLIAVALVVISERPPHDEGNQ
jgi:hypothetical protein